MGGGWWCCRGRRAGGGGELGTYRENLHVNPPRQHSGRPKWVGVCVCTGCPPSRVVVVHPVPSALTWRGSMGTRWGVSFFFGRLMKGRDMVRYMAQEGGWISASGEPLDELDDFTLLVRRAGAQCSEEVRRREEG